MRHAWHEFGKEFRYLRVRWYVLLAVLLLDLALNLEWLLPMQPMEPGTSAGVFLMYDILMRMLLWMVVWWFMLSMPPEDCASGNRGHGMTRPLSRMSYWTARLLVWVLLVIIPLLLEIAVYLLLNGRPFSEVALGMAERVWAVGSMTLWLLPLPLLLRGWERYAVIVMAMLSLDSPLSRLLRKIFEMLDLVYDPPQVMMEFGRSVQAAWLVGLLVPAVVLWHRRRPFGVLARIGAVMLLFILQQGLAASALFMNAYEKPRDPELIRRLTTGREVVIPGRDRHYQQEILTDGEKDILLRASARLEGMPGEYLASWRATATTVMQNGERMPAPHEAGEAPRQPFYAAGVQGLHYPMRDALPGTKPPGLLSVDVNPAAQNMQIRLPQPKRLDEAVSVHCDLAAEWVRMKKMGEMPLSAGAKFASPDLEIELLRVRPNEDKYGEKSPNCVTLVYRLSARSFEWRHGLQPWFPHPLIVSEKNRFMWQFGVHSGLAQMRGMNLGWTHLVMQLTFQRVLGTGTGVTAENLAEQRLVWVSPEYLGSSRHEMKLMEFEKISGVLLEQGGWPSEQPSVLMAGNPRETFLQQVRGMPRPAEGAGREEIARYVAAVYEASHVFLIAKTGAMTGEMKWPGNDEEVCLLLAPYLMKHPDLFRVALVHDNAELTQGVVQEALLQAGVPGVMRNEQTGGAKYEREAEVPGKPGEKRKRVMETVWLESWRPDDLEAYLEAIRQKSDEPLWPLMDDKPRSAEQVLVEYPRMFDPGDLRWLMQQSDVKVRERAEKMTREAYAELPAVARLDRDHEKPLHAAVALGMPEALDWLLRGVALKDDDEARSLLLPYFAMFGSASGAQPSTKMLLEFLQDARRHGAKGYRYDAAKMIWELQPERP